MSEHPDCTCPDPVPPHRMDCPAILWAVARFAESLKKDYRDDQTVAALRD